MMTRMLKGLVQELEDSFDGDSEVLLQHQQRVRNFLQSYYKTEMRGYEVFLDVEVDSNLEKGYQYIPRFEHIGYKAKELLKIACGIE